MREDDALVFRRLDRATQLGSGFPEGFLEEFRGLLGSDLFGRHVISVTMKKNKFPINPANFNRHLKLGKRKLLGSWIIRNG